jgi:hypothetical protein
MAGQSPSHARCLGDEHSSLIHRQSSIRRPVVWEDWDVQGDVAQECPHPA